VLVQGRGTGQKLTTTPKRGGIKGDPKRVIDKCHNIVDRKMCHKIVDTMIFDN
jgi:hypothetical protein